MKNFEYKFYSETFNVLGDPEESLIVVEVVVKDLETDVDVVLKGSHPDSSSSV